MSQAATPEASMAPAVGPTSHERTLHSLERLLGEHEAQKTWQQVCRAAEVADPASPDLDELGRIATVLSGYQGPLSLVGNSLSIRIQTYRMLHSAQRLESFLDGDGR